MKSMLLTGIREMEMRDVPDPMMVHEDDVLIRMKSIGVCGSDVHYYTTGRIGSQVVTYPFAVGHETAGVVEKVGKKVTRVKPGDKIALDPAVTCGTCDQCLAGREHTCRNLTFLGCPGQADGSLSEFMVMPERCCFPVPDHMSLDQAALSEPLSVGIYATRLSGLPATGTDIGILGCGPIGTSVLLASRVMGARKFYVTDRLDYRLERAKKAGATWTGNPDKEDIVKSISGLEPLSLDIVFECCGQQEAMEQAIALLKPGGKIVLVGIPEFDYWSIPADQIRRKEIDIQPVRRQNQCVQPALDMIAEGKVDVNQMITHHFPFDQTQKAFDLVDQYADGVMKAMITFD
jgi:L-iditol 2-dehydrogenase